MLNKTHTISLVLSLAILIVVVCGCSLNMNKELDFNLMGVKNPEIIKTFEVAEKNNKSVLLIFEAKWCPYCNKLNKETLPDKDVAETLENYELLQIDLDENPEDAAKFLSKSVSNGGDGIPTIIIFSSNGKEIYRTVGFYEAKEFNEVLKANY